MGTPFWNRREDGRGEGNSGFNSVTQAESWYIHVVYI